MTGRAVILGGDAHRIVTSPPPYWAKRDYEDGAGG